MLLQPTHYPDYCLHSERIDIWEFPLENLPPPARSLLNEEEQMRADRFYLTRHQRRFTVARAMLRVILAHYLQQDPQQLAFTYNDHGKPSVNNVQALEFNLSHSKELALVAVGKQFPLGVDVEAFSIRPYIGIARHLFSPTELESFFDLPQALQPFIFFHIWAQKEAFIKACGLGLSYPTQQFDVPLMPPANALIRDNLHHKNWRMLSFMAKLGYSAALCCNPKVKRVNYLRIEPRELM